MRAERPHGTIVPAKGANALEVERHDQLAIAAAAQRSPEHKLWLGFGACYARVQLGGEKAIEDVGNKT